MLSHKIMDKARAVFGLKPTTVVRCRGSVRAERRRSLLSPLRWQEANRTARKERARREAAAKRAAEAAA